ncbi:MAG: hypothetical protein WBF90_16950 [Rivularia sp. (in: cyanobacteria)]
MTAIKNDLKRIWACIEEKAPEVKDLFQPGLKTEEIDQITKDLPFKLPLEVYELYQWRNGLVDNTYFEFYGYYNSLSGHFYPFEETIRHIKKVNDDSGVFYFIIIFSLSGEFGGNFFAVPLGINECSVIMLYDDDGFYEDFDFNQEFKHERDNFKSIKNKTCLFDTRQEFNNIGDLIAEIADCAEQAFDSLEGDRDFVSIDLNWQKFKFIHYRYRFAEENKNIYCLTPAQETELFETKQRWLNLNDTPLNKQEATKVIQELYRYSEYEIPEIIFVPSFYTAHLGFFGKSNYLKQIDNKYLADKLKSLYWDFLLIPFDYALTKPVITSVLKSLKSELNEFLNDFIEYDLKSSIEKIFNNDINSNLERIAKFLYTPLKYDLRDALEKDSILLYFNYEHILSNDEFVASAALFEFAHLLGVEFDEQKLNLYISYCREIWCVIAFDKTVIICEKPQVSWNDNPLSYANEQPNLSFPDGYII